MGDEEAALLRAIAATPEDDAPRMVYADWLITRGDLRGELIQLQCAMSRMTKRDRRAAPIRERAQALLDRNAANWAPLADRRIRWAYARGFPCAFGHVGVFRWVGAEMVSWSRWYPDGIGILTTSGKDISATEMAKYLTPQTRHRIEVRYELRLDGDRFRFSAQGKQRGAMKSIEAVLGPDGLDISLLDTFDRRLPSGPLRHTLQGRGGDSRQPAKRGLPQAWLTNAR